MRWVRKHGNLKQKGLWESRKNSKAANQGCAKLAPMADIRMNLPAGRQLTFATGAELKMNPAWKTMEEGMAIAIGWIYYWHDQLSLVLAEKRTLMATSFCCLWDVHRTRTVV
jgi:hypothetical protein